MKQEQFEGLVTALKAREWRAGASQPGASNSRLLSKREKKKKNLAKKGSAGRLPQIAKGGASKRGMNVEADERPYAPDFPARRGAKLVTMEQTTAAACELVESSFCGFLSSAVDPDEKAYFDRARGCGSTAEPVRATAGRPPSRNDVADREDPRDPKVRYLRVCASAGCACAFDSDAAQTLHLPKKEPLAWLTIRLTVLEIRASKIFFTAAQVARLWELMPEEEAWAELRVMLLVICYRRIVDVENLQAVLLAKLPHRDLLRVRFRLGVLATFNPRHPDGFHRYTLSNHDEREALKVLIKLAEEEEGKQWWDELYKRTEGFDDSDWSAGWGLPVSWTEPEPKNPNDLHVPTSGTVQFTWRCSKPAWHVRDSLLHVVIAGSAPASASLFRLTTQGDTLRR